MLVLKRKTNQSIVLFQNGEQIAEIVVTKLTRSGVSLGIKADSGIDVIRNELVNQKGESNVD
tara:strand:+ start:689 stop:874 length:186 start_codon:yes stop_codon:yes gene_type:complete